jgi:hypothetical protein
MNLIEVVEELDGRHDMWFRPISMRDTGYAYSINPENKDYVQFVPTLHGGIPASFPRVIDILYEWEIVKPQDVLKEGKQQR